MKLDVAVKNKVQNLNPQFYHPAAHLTIPANTTPKANFASLCRILMKFGMEDSMERKT